MMRTWIGVALLAAAWLLGTGHYVAAGPIACTVVIVIGALLLCGSTGRLSPRREAWLAVALIVPAAWYASWPLRAAPLLILAGLVLELLPIPLRWPKPAGRGFVAAGVVMLAQAPTMAAYAASTGRCHDLPWPLPDALAGVARLLGIDAAADGPNLVLHSIRQTHRLAATWDLLVDPATLCFFVGSLAALAMVIRSRLPAGRRWPAWIAALRTLTLVVVVWLPIRAGLLLSVYLHRVLRADYDAPLYVMNLFFSPWVHLLMLLGPVLLAWRLVRLPQAAEGETDAADGHPGSVNARAWQYPAAVGMLLVAVAVFATALHWDPVGTRQQGRVMVVERHSTWEPTTRPYDTTWFGEDSCYNYAAAYRYCGQYFRMSRLLETDRIDHQKLQQCDVLLIKVPTTKDGLPKERDPEHYRKNPARYTKDEVAAVLRFVERGGGLLLIGDHTNVFNSGTYLNDIARPMGFTFRHDLLYSTGHKPYQQSYRTPQVPHPAIQHLPPMDFAVSNSIDPGRSRGRAVIRGSALFSLPSEYHHSNYMPAPEHRPEMRYGAFVQLWSTRYGKGRVLAFTDSTIFSNFCTFQPGKAELLVGMLEWLNHRGPPDPRPWLTAPGILLLAAGLWMARRRRDAWPVLLAAGTCGWVIASMAVAAVHRRHMPVPKIEPPTTPMTRVAVDRTLSEVPLSNGANVQGDGNGYGTFEQWIARTGCYTVRQTGPPTDCDDALLVICPNRSVSPQYRGQLKRYVAEGGKLLLVDSPENTTSTANSLLDPFDLSIDHQELVAGELIVADDWPGGIRLQRACPVSGGEPMARLDSTPVGAMTSHGQGTVMALGFGSFFNDRGMGYFGEPAVWMAQPNAFMLYQNNTYTRYNVQFALLDALLGDRRPARFFSARVVLDRTLSQVPLTGEDPKAVQDNGFKAFEDWIYFFGYRPIRGTPQESFAGDALVVLYPSREVSREFRSNLTQYVAKGGTVLVVDAPENTGSTANTLLKTFGLSIDRLLQQDQRQRRLVVEREKGPPWPNVAIAGACRVNGGRPFAYWGQIPVAATARHGKGAVTAVGFGSVFSNANMRASWSLEPASKTLYPANLQLAILSALISDRPFPSCIPNLGGQ